jgi:DNA sulfur modification protein DndD
MKFKKIHIENYKTYKQLDLNLEVTDERPIILIGGGNGCGKTTLFDAIYHALYGLKIKDARQFDELFNAGVKNESGLLNKHIILEVTFSGMVLNQEQQYKLKRAYMLVDNRVLESVTLNMGGNQFTYGSGTPQAQKSQNEEVVNKIIAANLPAELSNYFLFDAMKTSELVKEEQINKLIMKNINSVMGFNKYAQLRKVSETMLAEKKTERLENDKIREEYSNLTKKKQELENEIEKLKDDYEAAINYANEHQEQYNQFKEGKNADDITREKMNKIGQSIKETVKQECEYRQDIDNLAKDLETKVIFLKLASMLKPEVDVILHAKEETKSQRANILSDEQIERFTRNLVQLIEERYTTSKNIDTLALINELKRQQEEGDDIEDKYDFLTHEEVMQLDKLVNSAIVNPLAELDEKRSRLNKEIQEMPRQQQQLKEYQQALNGSDYTIIELYEANSKNIQQLKDDIENKGKELLELGKKIATYDYDMPQVPDPQYDMLCKLPDFFKALSAQLLRAKKANIERMMRDQLNMNLVVYAGVIGRVELSADDSDEISFKIFHKNNNEIYLSQLNAGAKQTVMQVLLKVLYNLGDYEPPVMIDTVMGVLDKESREVILERYFPDLAHQTILLSTDTEITTDHDFEKIQAYVAKTYTLHRDKENQCTTISEDYFGLKTKEF